MRRPALVRATSWIVVASLVAATLPTHVAASPPGSATDTRSREYDPWGDQVVVREGVRLVWHVNPSGRLISTCRVFSDSRELCLEHPIPRPRSGPGFLVTGTVLFGASAGFAIMGMAAGFVCGATEGACSATPWFVATGLAAGFGVIFVLVGANRLVDYRQGVRRLLDAAPSSRGPTVRLGTAGLAGLSMRVSY